VCTSLVLALSGCSASPASGTDDRKSGPPAVVQAKTDQPAEEARGVAKTPPAAEPEEKTVATPSAETNPTRPAAEYRPTAALPYRARRSDPVTHEVDFSVVVTAPYHTKVLKVWLPLPQSDAGQEISESELSTFPMEVMPKIAAEPVYGNRFAYFEFAKPEGAQIIRHKFRATVWDLHWDVDPAGIVAVEKWPDDFEAYLRPQSITKKKEFDDLVQQIVAKRTTAAQDMFLVMDWVDANLKYDHANASLRADAEHAFGKLCGHCSDYHGLCATMGRTLGYPTRVTYGLSLFPKNSPSHCKFEAFLPPHGWVSFDVAETQQMVQAIGADKKLTGADQQRLTAAARQRLKRGFRENSWLLVTKGTNYDLAPKASGPVPVVRTIYAEADGQPLPDPDPANEQKREFAWMTVHQYKADKKFAQPFKDYATLEASNE
jgi:transglutaminase-like putative cysteine protease